MTAPQDNPTGAGKTAKPDISSDEVDALLDGEKAAAPDGTPRPYDLIAHDKIVRGRLPVLDRINERWVTDLHRDLGELLHQELEIAPQSVQLVTYGEWLASLPVPTSFNVCSAKPWPRNAVVAIDGKLLFVLVDNYYGGGARKGPAPVRETLTPTEQRLNKIIVDLVTGHFRGAFAPVAQLEFQQLQAETNPNYVSLATPSEPVVVTRVDVSLREAGGAVTLVFPLSSFEPVRDKLAEGLKAVSPEIRQRWRHGLQSQLENTQLDLVTVFLETEISMRELLKLKPGDILPVEMPKMATLRAGAHPLLRGKFGRSRGYNAVSVIETVRNGPTKTEERKR